MVKILARHHGMSVLGLHRLSMFYKKEWVKLISRLYPLALMITLEPRRDRTCLWGFRQSAIQTSLLSYRDWLEKCNFALSKSLFDTL